MTTVGASALVLAGCKFPRRWEVLEPYVVPPEEQLAGQPTWYASTCRQCPAGCGIIVRIMNGRAVKLEGNPRHPLNQGKLCARGQAGLQVLYNPDRLTGPQSQAVRGSKQFTSLSWDDGVKQLADKIQAANGKVAVWAGSSISGHLYDLFSRLTQAIGGQAPLVFDLFTLFNGYNSLAQAGQSLFGSSQLPAFSLVGQDVVFSFGANFTGPSLSSTRYGIEFGKFRSQALGKRGYLVQFEPRLSPTGSKADRWVAVRPGSEGVAAQAILAIIAGQSSGPAERISRAKTLAPQVDLNQAAAACDVSVQDLQDLAGIFLRAQHAIAIPGEGLAGQPGATDLVAAVQALNIVAGTPVTLSSGPQQSNLLKPDISSFGEAQRLIASMAAGDVQVLLVWGANPLYEFPAQVGFADALKKVPFVVSFASILDETAAQADLILPDRTYLESWGYEVTAPDFGQPALGAQQPVVTPLFDLRSTADVLLEAAKSIPAASSALNWSDEVAFLKEQVAQLPPAKSSTPGRAWSNFLQQGGWFPVAPAAAQGGSPATPPGLSAQPLTYQGDAQTYPYYLHLYLSDLLSDGRGASQPWLQGSPDVSTTIAWQSWVEINPTTAQKLGIKQGDIVQIKSPFGQVEAAVYLYPAIRPDTVALPLGQGHTELGRYAANRGANAIQLTGQQGGAGDLLFNNLRVQVSPTGRSMWMATFEYTVGVDQGFSNKGFPGD